MTNTVPTPDYTYVSRLHEKLKAELDVYHRKVDEIERLRYYEDPIPLNLNKPRSNIEVRIGTTAELIENIKAASTTNPPKVSFHPHKNGTDADTNGSKREKFWNRFLININKPVPTLNEDVDSQVGLGIGILKAAYNKWPTEERKQGKEESNKAYNARMKQQKKIWGVPFTVINVHPRAYYFRLGQGNQIAESLEVSFKPKVDVYPQYGLNPYDVTTTDESKAWLQGDNRQATVSGQPPMTVTPLPMGVSTENMAEVVEYYSRPMGVYQVYINGKKRYEETGSPNVAYFICTGRSSSSRDPDKFGISVAEIMRHNEPVINRVLTDMGEAADRIVKKRLTVQFPEGSTDNLSGEVGADNNPIFRTFTFSDEHADSLPAGAEVRDPFAGSEHVYAAMPFVELMLRINGQHGVAPIFKGQSPGAGGSGYRDNSLYLMAKAQYQYLLDSYAYQLEDLIRWCEQKLVELDDLGEIYCDEFSLKPNDISKWPATIIVSVDPVLPQNFIAEGNFYAQMHAQGHVTRRTVLEQGLGLEQPEDETFNRLLEDLQQALMPTLVQDVMEAVMPAPAPPEQSGLVDTQGNPLQSENAAMGGGGNTDQLLAMINGRGNNGGGPNGGRSAQQNAGNMRAGQSRVQPQQAGEFPPR